MNKNIAKSMVTLMVLASISSAGAHPKDCNYSLDYNIDIDEKQITFDSKGKSNIVFKSEQLIIDGNPLVLTTEQLQSSKDFQKQTRAIVAKIARIAIEGAEIGVKAATIAMTSLFGESKEVHNDLIKPIEAISEKIKANISDTSLNTRALEKSFENEFEKEIKKLVEVAVSKYSGKIISQVMSSIFSGDSEDMEDFEFRMENMEHDIERYVDKHAKALEKSSDELCIDLKTIAELDKQLESIKGFPAGGIIQEDSKGGFQVSNLSIKHD